MKIKFATLYVLLMVNLMGFTQTAETVLSGRISYITSQNVYVKFESTVALNTGDTLWLSTDAQKIPALVVLNKSSISCVCKNISSVNLSVNQTVTGIAHKRAAKIADVLPAEQKEISDTLTKPVQPTGKHEKTNLIDGRISLASYTTFSNTQTPAQRMRYTVYTKYNPGTEKHLSADAYLTFTHKNNNWNEIKTNVFNGLKIYALAGTYTTNKKNQITLGRKINAKISNIGAIDGVQYQTRISVLDAGAFVGSRPDYSDYTFNPNLFQYGAWLSHSFKNQNGTVQNTLAFVDQYYRGASDRRYAYMQHINGLAKNLYFFGSAEIDLFHKELNPGDSSLNPSNKPKLTNVHLSLRYRPFKKLNLNASYSAIKNVVYYESFKTYLDQLLDAFFLQGYNLRISYRPFKRLAFGINSGYRFTKEDSHPAKNIQAFIYWYQLPYISGNLMLTPSFIDTKYLKGQLLNINYSRDIVPGLLYGGMGYRFFHYDFQYTTVPLAQHIAELNLQFAFKNKLSFGLNYEGTFDKGQKIHALYLNLNKRF